MRGNIASLLARCGPAAHWSAYPYWGARVVAKRDSLVTTGAERNLEVSSSAAAEDFAAFLMREYPELSLKIAYALKADAIHFGDDERVDFWNTVLVVLSAQMVS